MILYGRMLGETLGRCFRMRFEPQRVCAKINLARPPKAATPFANADPGENRRVR
jgi:hypothetical protein